MKYWILTAIMFAISALLYWASGELVSEVPLWLSGVFGGEGFFMLTCGIADMLDI
jgi:hypothetical protein